MSDGFVKLDEARVDKFANDSTAQFLIPPLISYIKSRKNLAHGDISILDVGGGDGTFLDNIMRNIPNSFGTLVELSSGMISRNSNNSRKTLVNQNFLEWAKSDEFSKNKFDVICFNFVLHHFVGYDRRRSIEYQREALNLATNLLKQDGTIIVYEIHYNGFIQKEIPSIMIHALTSSVMLSKIIKFLGANTAGYGVCFHSEMTWKRIFQSAFLNVDHEFVISTDKFIGLRSKLQRFILNIGSMQYKIHFLKKDFNHQFYSN